MVHGSKPYIFSEDKCSVFFRDPVIRADNALRGDAAQTDDNLRTKEERFVFQIWHACFLLHRKWGTVTCLLLLTSIAYKRKNNYHLS